TPEVPHYIPPASDYSDSNTESTCDESDSEADDELSSDASLDHGGSIGPNSNPVVPGPDPDPPHNTQSEDPAPRPPSPIGIGARLPRHNRMKPREWWKLSAAQLDSDIDDDIEDADLAYEIAFLTSSATEPLSYTEALRRPDAEQWKQAALEELALGNLFLDLLARR
ncbi:hypothetical protein AZE42_12966, partial [Rhizopogon vesiculosus]